MATEAQIRREKWQKDLLGRGSIRTVVLALLFSASAHFACFWAWPGDPDWDVNHSVFAAQNFLAHKGLRSINLFPEPTDDLARHTEIKWMTHWPPAHSFLYLAVMMWGVAPGPATKILVFFCVVLGGLGWILLARSLDGTPLSLIAVGVAYPWLSFMGRAYLDYKNDHLACALAPWVYLCVMRIEPLKKIPGERWGRLLLAALLAGITIWVKYSMAPLIAASGLYVLYLDGLQLSPKRIVRIGVFDSVLVLPGFALWGINRFWGGNQYPLTGGGLSFSLPVFAKNIVSHTFGSATGWDLVFIQLNLALEKWFGIHLVRGTVFTVSLAVLIVWALYLLRRRWDEKERQFCVYLFLLTFALCGTLALTTIMSRIKYDFSSDGRFSMPISYGWLMLATLALGKIQDRSVLRSAAFYSLIIPVAFSACFFAGKGTLTTPYLRLPRSKLMWSETFDANHPAFFSHLAADRPDLIVPPDGRFMVEFGIPAFYVFVATRGDGHEYYSSVDLKVLALVLPEDEQMLLKKFRNASRTERVAPPPGFPYVIYRFDFNARKRGIPQSLEHDAPR
jgi:hypothetical protein